MITLFASLIGFLSSIVPEVLKIFNDRSDKRHMLKILQMDPEQVQAPHSLYNPPPASVKTQNSGVAWVDGLNGTVRPMLAYSFFFLYSVSKVMQYKAVSGAAPLVQYLDVIWNSDDQAVFAGVICFYFGQRTFAKLPKKV